MRVSIPANQVCTFNSDGSFSVWEIVNGERDSILGPAQSTSRIYEVGALGGLPRQVEVVHKENVSVTTRFRKSAPRRETPDQTPVEVPYTYTHESLAETLRRFIREERANDSKDDELETLEESMDLDVDDDDDDFRSPYEFEDMTFEEPIEEDSPGAAQEAAEAPKSPQRS